MIDPQDVLPVGKLAPSFLSELLEKYTMEDETVVVGPKVGMDATVIDQGDFYLIAKTDPITFVTESIGHYAIHVNANDIACMGGIPRWFLATVLLPEKKSDRLLVENIFSQLQTACQELDILFCGGHTEITYGLDRPIIVGQMLGVAEKGSLVTGENVRPGDDVLLSKGIAIEATSIIAREKAEPLTQLYSAELVEKCRNFLYDPGISVIKDAKLAVEIGGVHAMHDPTEGGLAMGLHELAIATGLGLKIFEHEILILPESKLLCDQYDIDPMGAIASGALLIVVDPHFTSKIIENLKKNQIEIRNIGKVMPVEYGVKLVIDNDEIDLPLFHQDEITKLFQA
ncbi:MAG: AIR synthase family protein [candidate division KSB1 bacterium]|nr:AIR synthase family protein [candidate division KSB1 bacterium]MDZ7334824.1 AIR synthase family protein [candidate division KSB1 bacterium]MDZ7356546.1 AIR synthase family protein [candidate division KSB1 bacterium]MDZ7376291.1 AIR synthase family protein [candidate division KSB1 bacterium]MDZ7400447.1 AIR synthase family protein [candidate division KSB1 bacterium]